MDSTDDLREPIKRVKSLGLPSLTKERVMRECLESYQRFTKWVLRHTPEIEQSQRGKDLLAEIDEREQKVKSALCSEPDTLGKNHDELPEKSAEEITYTHICDQCGTRFEDTSPCLLPTHIILCPECNVL